MISVRATLVMLMKMIEMLSMTMTMVSWWQWWHLRLCTCCDDCCLTSYSVDSLIDLEQRSPLCFSHPQLIFFPILKTNLGRFCQYFTMFYGDWMLALTSRWLCWLFALWWLLELWWLFALWWLFELWWLFVLCWLLMLLLLRRDTLEPSSIESGTEKR